MSNLIKTYTTDGAMVVQFNRSEVRNSLSGSVLDELEAILDTTYVLPKLVFTGSNGVFASGADLREINALTAKQSAAFAQRGQHLMTRIASLRVRTIAAIGGACFGGALDLALACRLRVSSPDAMFCHPGAGLGIITGWGGTQRLPRLIGEANALEMFFTAEPISAVEALRIGLIDGISEDPLTDALNLRTPPL